jgi:hypothetical protein
MPIKSPDKKAVSLKACSLKLKTVPWLKPASLQIVQPDRIAHGDTFWG